MCGRCRQHSCGRSNVGVALETAVAPWQVHQAAKGRHRAFERFFGTIVSRLSARVPSYTGANPWDLRRAPANPKGNLRH